jgi:phospho-N-acetylmuramoyl-pentapeptide-transferase
VKLGQKVREEEPQTHYVKAGTPTMGGLLMLVAIAVPVLLCGNFHNKQVWLALFTTLWLGGLGFLDDWLRVVKKFPKGLLGRYKLVGQFAIGALVAWCILRWPEPGAGPTMTHIPFMKSYYADLGLLFVPFVMLVITGSSNAVNLTDGLDGLASDSSRSPPSRSPACAT